MTPAELAYEALTERECRAIRAAHDGFGDYTYDCANDVLRFKDREGTFSLTRVQVSDYVRTWRRSGLWTLQGRLERSNKSDGMLEGCVGAN